MSEYYNEAWYDERWQAMPQVMRKVAADAIKKVLDEETVELIKAKHAEHGRDWIHYLIDIDPEETPFLYDLGMTTMSAHHGWGTGIRNLLRDEEGANIRDEDLPPAPYEGGVEQSIWDDYYVQAVEAAVGLRDV